MSRGHQRCAYPQNGSSSRNRLGNFDDALMLSQAYASANN